MAENRQPDDTAELRKQLLAAREQITNQISDLEYPRRGPFVYHEGIEKLKNTLAEIDEALAGLDQTHA